MPPAVIPEAIDPPAALSAFLRGVERRGLILAQLQCADEAVAEKALLAATSAFAAHPDQAVIALWPRRFWSLLAASPALRAAQMAGHWRAPFVALGDLASEDRLALLLRIVAGLDEAAAAEVIGIDVAAYQQALARACPRDAAGQPDAVAWRALAEAAQQAVRDLPPDRLERVQRQRETQGNAPLRTVAPPVAARRKPRAHGSVRRPARTWWRIVSVLALLLALVVGGWWWHRHSSVPVSANDEEAALVQVEELPVDGDLPPPVSTPAIAAADLAMLSDAEFETAREADFYAWVAAGGPLPVDESEPRSSAQAPSAAGLETLDDAQ